MGNTSSELITNKTETSKSLTIVNVLDELDLALVGKLPLNPQLLYTLNTFVDAFVLTDEIFISFRDSMHLNLAAPAFEGERPLVKMLVKNGLLRTIFEGKQHLEQDTGTVIYVDPEADFENDQDSIRRYKEAMAPELVKYLVIPTNISDLPSTTPLLILGTKGVVAVFERSIQGLANSILTLSSGSQFHPTLPPYTASIQSSFFSYTPPAVDLYKKLADVHHVKINDLLRHRGVKEVVLPPLTAILLSRCRTRDDIPEQLQQLRAEFEPLRTAGRQHEKRLATAQTLGEQFQAIDEFNEFWDIYSQKLSRRSTRLVYRVWNIVKSANPVKWFTDTLDQLSTCDQEHLILNRYASLTNLWQLSCNSPTVQEQVKSAERVFTGEITKEAWETYAQWICKVAPQLPQNAKDA